MESLNMRPALAPVGTDWFNGTMSDFILPEVRWGIIGVGDVCEVKSAPALQQVEGSQLVAVMRRNGEKAADYARRHGVPRWYDDAEALINDPEVNAIYIATPPDVHEAYTLRAAAAGKAVYVEKPMARDAVECERMIEACAEAGVPLFVAYYRRSLPNILKVKALLKAKAIGEVRYVDVKVNKPIDPKPEDATPNPNHWRTIPEIAGGGYFYDLASHQLDVLDFLFGPIEHAAGIAANLGGTYDAEDTTMGHFRFATGVMGHGAWCFCTSQSATEEVITVVGDNGQIKFNCFGDQSVDLQVDGEADRHLTFDIPKHIQQPLIQTMVDELRGKGECPSTGVSGARTAEVMDQLCERVD